MKTDSDIKRFARYQSVANVLLYNKEIVRRVEVMFKSADDVGKRVASATTRAEKLTQAAYRTSAAFQRNPYAVSVWLRQGEIEAQKSECKAYNSSSFRASLHEIRALTMTPPEVFEPKMKNLCSEAGVAVMFVPELPGTRVYGATRWLNPNKALIQLSLRGKSDDDLWFTFFHEAAHILLHGKCDVFIEAEDEGRRKATRHDKEMDADRFAQDFLIPSSEYQSFMQGSKFSLVEIQQFAKK